jgi:hypothetical protein
MEYKEVGKNGQNSSGTEHRMHTVKESLGSVKARGGVFTEWEAVSFSGAALPHGISNKWFDFLHLVDLQIFWYNTSEKGVKWIVYYAAVLFETHKIEESEMEHVYEWLAV